MAIISPCQGGDGSSILLTRSEIGTISERGSLQFHWATRSSNYCYNFERGSSRPFWAGDPLFKHMFYIYVLKSNRDNRTYVGYTNNLQERLSKHNSGQVKSTQFRRPLELLFSEEFDTSVEARKRELYWKSGGGRRKLKEMIE